MSLDLMQRMLSPPRVSSSAGGTPYQTASRGNRYIPPTYNYGRNPMGGNAPNYRDMQWNTMQDYYLPNATNRPLSGQIQQGGRDSQDWMNGQYGNPNRQPVMPQFRDGDPYNMYDSGDMSYYDQLYGQQGRDDNAAFMANGGSTPRGGQGGQQGGSGGARPRFDPRMLAALMRGGMSEGDMFGDSGGRGESRGRRGREGDPRGRSGNPMFGGGNKPMLDSRSGGGNSSGWLASGDGSSKGDGGMFGVGNKPAYDRHGGLVGPDDGKPWGQQDTSLVGAMSTWGGPPIDWSSFFGGGGPTLNGPVPPSSLADPEGYQSAGDEYFFNPTQWRGRW